VVPNSWLNLYFDLGFELGLGLVHLLLVGNDTCLGRDKLCCASNFALMTLVLKSLF